MNNSGSLSLIVGPVLAGKTSELIRQVRRFHLAKRRCLIARYDSPDLHKRSDLETQYEE
jgi:thymidine kinase